MINDVILKMILYFGKDARRVNHALKVFGFADAIAAQEKLDLKSRQLTALAAILHDIGIKEAEIKHNSSAGNYQELEGPPVARVILNECNIPADIIDRVCYLVGHHHSYQKIEGLDFQILVEADFLVNIFEDEISENTIEIIRNKYFKTQSGKVILDSLYSNPK